MRQYRHGRIVLSYLEKAPSRLTPFFLHTASRCTDPWIWRVFWLRLCLGYLKSDWNRPVKLTRQLRRQLERKGRLVMGPVAAILLLACPGFGYPGDWYAGRGDRVAHQNQCQISSLGAIPAGGAGNGNSPCRHEGQ